MCKGKVKKTILESKEARGRGKRDVNSNKAERDKEQDKSK
jgi:hypothetical protein